MITLTTLRDVRCSLRPDRILAVEAGSPTTVRLTNGLSVQVREPADHVQRRLDEARGRGAAEIAAAGQGRERTR